VAITMNSVKNRNHSVISFFKRLYCCMQLCKKLLCFMAVGPCQYSGAQIKVGLNKGTGSNIV